MSGILKIELGKGLKFGSDKLIHNFSDIKSDTALNVLTEIYPTC